MNVENAVMPTMDQIAATFHAPEAGPFVMVNLLKFREVADYASGEKVSGREAYLRYGDRVRVLAESLGGRVIYSGAVTGLMLGQVEELWDAVALMEYPSRAAFLAMTQMPEFHEIEVHRAAGLAGQLNIETRAMAAG
ncbi:MAG: DUF1330 domain-containing protein [Phenylobacterium sp.]|uniref:DUF1330 domain-containing protein n=1 Tax=Phenylobacterium sp. TaxID=1871053 RepID=UPI00391A7348